MTARLIRNRIVKISNHSFEFEIARQRENLKLQFASDALEERYLDSPVFVNQHELKPWFTRMGLSPESYLMMSRSGFYTDFT